MVKAQTLCEYITSDIILFIMDGKKISSLEAMQKIYTSDTFAKLTDVETGLYLESSKFVYSLFKSEQEYGKLTK